MVRAFVEKYWQQLLLFLTLFLMVAGTCASFLLHKPLLICAPLVVVLLLQLYYDYKPLYLLMVAMVPLSIPLEIPGGFATDLPSEQLMWLFTGIFFINVLGGKQFNARERISTFYVFIFLLLFWSFFCTVTSEIFFRSFKYWVSKLWYFAAFVFMADKMIGDMAMVKRVVWAFLLPFCAIILYGTARHATDGFSFEASNVIASPFYINHVIYGAAAALAVPLAWLGIQWYSPKSPARYVMAAALLLVLLAAGLSYARGAWVAVVAVPVVAFLIHRKVFDKLIYVGIVVLVLGVSYLVTDNNFYKFAPNYQKTIFHEGDIEAHLSSTFDGTDVSGMERVYRWIAAKNMVATRPLQGFGPSTFSQVYKRYSDEAFRTYVSINKEQSTTHNYYLMTFAEQGFVGGILFLGFCVFMLLKANRVYHAAKNPLHRNLAMASVLSFVTILLHLCLNELIETDKIGAFFWLNAVFIYKAEGWVAAEKAEAVDGH